MAFWHRIGKSNLKIASVQFRRCYYVHLPHAPSLNSNLKPPPMEMPHPQSFFHARPATVFYTVRFFAAPVQFQVKHKNEEDCTSGPRLNDQIKAPYVRLVRDDGHSIVSRFQALEEAKKLKLDLVEVQRETAGKPSVCKIMDYNQEMYKRQQKEKERAKSKADRTLRRVLKEMRFSEKTEIKDLQTKADLVKKLMEKGYRVKLRATGNENSDLTGSLSRLFALIEDICVVESGPSLKTKEAFMIVRHVKYGLTKKGGNKLQDAAQTTVESEEDDAEPLTPDSNDSIEYKNQSSAESWFENEEKVLSTGNEHIVTPAISENRYRRADAQVPPTISENRDRRTDAQVPPAASENRYRRAESQVPPGISENRYRRADAQMPPAMSENRYRRADAQVPHDMSENRYRRAESQVPPVVSENRYRRPDAQVPPAMSENRYRRPDARVPPAMSENRYRRADQLAQNNVPSNVMTGDNNRYARAEPRNTFQQTSNNTPPNNNQGAGIRNPDGSIPSNSNQTRYAPQNINFIPKIENTKQGVTSGSRNRIPSSHEDISRHPSAANNTPRSSYGIFSK